MALRGLPGWVCESVGLGFVAEPLPGDERFRGMLSFPYRVVGGDVVGLRYRRLEGEGSKYTQPSGQRTGLFMVDEVVDQPVVHVSEGEIDCLTLAACGLKACGVPGANSWKDFYFRLFEGCRSVFVWSDGDAAGDAMWGTVRECLPQAVRVVLPRGADVSDVFQAEGEAGVLGLLEAAGGRG